MNVNSVEKKKPGRPRGTIAKAPGGMTLGKDSSREAKRLAAAILEVLAGTRTPAQAAEAVSVSLPRYYQLEAQGLRGLLEACEPRSKGPRRGPRDELAALRRENERLQREVGRQQSLARLAQRAVGLAPPAAAPAKAGSKKKRRRKPVARALAVVNRFKDDEMTNGDQGRSSSEA